MCYQTTSRNTESIIVHVFFSDDSLHECLIFLQLQISSALGWCICGWKILEHAVVLWCPVFQGPTLLSVDSVFLFAFPAVSFRSLPLSISLSLCRCRFSSSLCLWFTPCCRSPCGTPSSPASWPLPLTPLCWAFGYPWQSIIWNQWCGR